MVVIDGSEGEGGGQILRTALTLSMWTGQPFRVENVRAKRSRPGLLRQHLTALHAAAEVSGAQVEGGTLGSSRFTFRPGSPKAGNYVFDIGSAGSTTLVLQAVFFALVHAQGESRVVIEGGTHNPLAPPFDFLARTWLPLVERMGVRASLKLERHGFFPAGGGKIVAHIQGRPEWKPLELVHRGAVEALVPRALVSALPRKIAERELTMLCEALGIPREERFQPEEVSSPRGPGNVVMVEVTSSSLTELMVGFGEKGVPAERVVEQVAQEVKQYLRGNVPVGAHLADQLLLPMALGSGGVFRTLPLSGHAATHAALLPRFLPMHIHTEEEASGAVRVEVRT